MKKLLTLSAGLLSMYLLNTGQAQTTVTFNYTGSLQTWVVPTCVDSITISAKGAQGGFTDYSNGASGGLGAHITGKVAVTPGQVIKILVGGMGQKLTPGTNGLYLSAGGGGGSFVWDSSNTTVPIIVAGGGGGANSCSWTNGDPGQATLGGSGLGGITLCGGGCDNGNGVGGGGAGWLTNGASCGGCAVAQIPLNGGVGGIPCLPLGGSYLGGAGGYGGGGQGDGNCGGGGGGGGYTGGDGGGNTIICNNSPSRGGTSYNTGVNQVNLAGINAGNGEITITFNAAVNAGVASATPNPICAGDSTEISLTGSNGTIQWEISTDGGSTWNTINGATNSTYSTPALFANTCYRAGVTCGSSVFSNTICVTVHPLPTVNFTMQDTVCLNQGTVTLTGGTPNGGTYSGNGVSGNIFNPQMAGLGTHVITYSYTDGNGCSNTSSFSVVVDACLGVNHFNPLSSISIFPNPTKGAIQVTLPNGIGQVKAEVVDMQGKVIYTQEQLQVTGGIANLDIQHVSNGLYHINFTTNEYKHAVKVALQK